jgi:uncharacterized spore protein YtfJ
MMSNNITELLSTIIGELRKVATTETIIGESVKLGDKMVVPVSRVTVGFGAGGGEGQAPDKGSGFGGGGGGGARIEPVGFIVIDGDKVAFLPTKPGRFDNLIEAIPGIIDKVADLKKGKGKGEDKAKAE